MALRKKKAAKPTPAPRADKPKPAPVSVIDMATALCDRHHAGNHITRAESMDLCAAADRDLSGWRRGAGVSHTDHGIAMALAVKARARDLS